MPPRSLCAPWLSAHAEAGSLIARLRRTKLPGQSSRSSAGRQSDRPPQPGATGLVLGSARPPSPPFSCRATPRRHSSRGEARAPGAGGHGVGDGAHRGSGALLPGGPGQCECRVVVPDHRRPVRLGAENVARACPAAPGLLVPGRGQSRSGWIGLVLSSVMPGTGPCRGE